MTFPIAPRFRMMYLPARGTRPKQRGMPMSKRTLALVAMVSCATMMGLALPAHHGVPASADVRALNVTIQEWAVPSKGAHPHDPAVGPDGALWFTEQMVNKLARLDPATGEMKEYPLKGPNDGPHGLVADRDGNIWYTGNFAAYIGKLNP